MMKRTLFTAMVTFLPVTAHAELHTKTLFGCDGDLSLYVDLPFTKPSTDISCIGDLSFTGAYAKSDAPFSIFATRNISFIDVLITAPELHIKAIGEIFINELSVLTAPIISLDANQIALIGRVDTSQPKEPLNPINSGTLNTGGTIYVGSPPSTPNGDYDHSNLAISVITVRPDSSNLNGVTAIPEPPTALLLSLGMAFISAMKRRGFFRSSPLRGDA